MKKMYKLVYYSSIVAILFTGSCKKDDAPPALALTDFGPKSAGTEVEVNIFGQGFSPTPSANTVLFNGVKADVTTVGSGNTYLTVKVPAGGTTGKISVQVGSQSATTTDDFVYLAPTVSSLNPDNGAVGETITIDGSNFSTKNSNNIVKFNGTIATPTSVSANRIVVTVPVGASTGKVTVQVGEQIGTCDYEFFYQQPVTVTTYVGSTTAGYADGNSNPRFNGPVGVAVDNQGSIYVADSKNHSVRMVTASGTVFTLAGRGTPGLADGDTFSAKFNEPVAVAVDASYNVYVADSKNYSIRKVTPMGDVTTLAGSGVAGFANGTGSAAQFNNLQSIAVDATGNVYVGEYTRIRKITPAGEVSTYAGTGIDGFADGNATSAQFSNIGGLVTDASGNVFATSNGRIRKITPAGIVSTYPSRIYDSYSNYSLTGITLDKNGNFYVMDYTQLMVMKIFPSGTTGTYAGSGRLGFADGTGKTAEFRNPIGLAIDSKGVLYVADGGYSQSNCIRKIVPQN